MPKTDWNLVRRMREIRAHAYTGMACGLVFGSVLAALLGPAGLFLTLPLAGLFSFGVFNEDGPRHDELCDRMDAPWWALTAADHAELRRWFQERHVAGRVALNEREEDARDAE